MINRIKAFLDRSSDTSETPKTVDETQLAAAALLVEVGRIDGNFDDAEWQAVKMLVKEHFALSEVEAEALIAAADEEVEGSVEVYRFARAVKDKFDMNERVKMIEMLWRVVYADGMVHDYEANLLRRMAGLIYVSDRDSGTARKKVLAEISLAEQ